MTEEIALAVLGIVIVALIGLTYLQSVRFFGALNDVFQYTDQALQRSQANFNSVLDRLMASDFDTFKAWQSTDQQQGSVSVPEDEEVTQVSPGRGLWGGTIPTSPPPTGDEPEEPFA